MSIIFIFIWLKWVRIACFFVLDLREAKKLMISAAMLESIPIQVKLPVPPLKRGLHFVSTRRVNSGRGRKSEVFCPPGSYNM
jgi:hypothetical protein